MQRGSLVYVYDKKGRRLTSLLAGKGPKDELQGYTSSTVSVRRGSLIYTYDERGRRLGSTLAGRCRQNDQACLRSILSRQCTARLRGLPVL